MCPIFQLFTKLLKTNQKFSYLSKKLHVTILHSARMFNERLIVFIKLLI